MRENFNMKRAGAAYSLIILLGLAALPFSCSNNRIPTALPSTHTIQWMDTLSVNFHGNFVLNDGTGGCVKCHGHDYTGGSVNVSCVDCHLKRTNMCTRCHGGYDLNDKSGAPPYGLRKEISDTTRAVGAHTIHLNGSALAGPQPCSSCHAVPAFVSDSVHFGFAPNSRNRVIDSIAKITWGGFSNRNGNAAWNRSTLTCTFTYCHGNFTGGDTNNTPVWNVKNRDTCGTCHDIGSNPSRLGGNHLFHVAAASFRCRDCHAGTVDSNLNIVTPALHIDGINDVLVRDTALCNKCHGTGADQCIYCHGGIDNKTGAPPKGLRGETAATTRAVGTHTKHLQGGTLSNGIKCSDCHIVPAVVESPGHYSVDSVAQIVWSPLSNKSGGATWNRNTLTCALTYCHGNFSGGTSTTPVWTSFNQAPCGACHDIGSNPASLLGLHDTHVIGQGLGCYQCHNTVVNSSFALIGPSLHIDGIFTVSYAAGPGTYDNTTHNCAPPCHDPQNWYSGGGK